MREQSKDSVRLSHIVEAIERIKRYTFRMSFDDFVISYFTTGPGINNISTYVYASVKRINPSVNALSTIIILMVTVVLIVVNVVPVIRERKGKKNVQEIN